MRRAVRGSLLAMSIGVLLGCQDDNVDLSIMVIVPAAIESIPSGVLRLSLWTYDPILADAPATLADADSVRFSRNSGTEQQFRMRVKASVPGGLKYYVTIRGFELLPECEKYILWDGIESLGTPRNIVMQAVPIPSCVD